MPTEIWIMVIAGVAVLLFSRLFTKQK